MARFIALSFAALMSLPALAEEPAPPPAAKDAAAPAAGDRADWKAHVDAATAFLKAWGKGKWDDAKSVAADKVEVKIGDKTYAIDVAGGKSDAKLVLPFRGLSAIRDAGKMKGVAVNEITVEAGGEKKSGKGKVMTSDAGGSVKVASVEVE